MDVRIKELLKNTFIFGIGLIGVKLVQFFLLPFFTTNLSTSQFGIIELIITLASLMVPIVTMQISDSVLRFGLSKNYNSKSVFQNTIIILCLSSIATILFSFFFLFWEDVKEWITFLCFIIILQSFRTNFAIFAKVKNKNLIYSIDGIVYALANAFSNIIAIKIFNLGISGYFISEIIALCISLVFLFISCKYKDEIIGFKNIDFPLLIKMIKYSSPLVFNGISWWITNFSDRAILSFFFPISFVGIYSVAAKIPAIITTALSMFTQAWIMSSVKEYEEDNRKLVFQKVYNVYSSFLFLGVTLAIIVIKPFLNIYIGKDFFEAWKYVPFLLVGVTFLGISNYFSGIYVAAKKNISEVKTTVMCASINIILNFLLIPKFGINGAVIATLISYVSIVIIRIIDIKNIIIINSNIVFIFTNLLLLLLMSFCLISEKDLLVFAIAIICFGLNILFIINSIKIGG